MGMSYSMVGNLAFTCTYQHLCVRCKENEKIWVEEIYTGCEIAFGGLNTTEGTSSVIIIGHGEGGEFLGKVHSILQISRQTENSIDGRWWFWSQFNAQS